MNPTLKRTLGLPSLIAVGVGVVVGQGPLVTNLHGVGISASGFFIALIVAFVLTISYVFTFTELSLMLPKAGGISTYTEVAIGHFPAIVVTIGGYVGMSIFAGAADLFLLNFVLDVLYPGAIPHAGLWIFLLIIVLNVLGIDVFASAQNMLAYTMLAVMLVVGIAGLGSAEAAGAPVSNLFSGFHSIDGNFLSLTVLALWAFVGLEFMCPLVEETIDPERNLPRAMFISSLILLIAYGLFTLAGYHLVAAGVLKDSPVPHWELIRALFGDSGRLLMAVLAVTAASTSINTGIASVSRMMYGMAQNGQLPGWFGKLHPKYRSPWFSILFLCCSAVSAYLVFAKSQNVVILMMISATTIWLLVYIIAHIDLIVLRRRCPGLKRPFRSPLYPAPQIVGIIGMVYLLFNNSPEPEMTRTVYLSTGMILVVVSLFAACWIRFAMKKSLFEPVPIETSPLTPR